MEISHMYMQRPFFAVQFPDSYNYGFLGNTIGHEFFHQFSPKRVNEFWQKNERYIESTDCYTEFYDDICFDLSLYDSVTNGTKVREVCTKGSTDLGENMPDVEGARVAFETMRAELGEVALKERAMPEFHYTNEQMFFVAMAQLHCDKDLNNHQYLADDMLDEDPHASGNVRVNGIAMQMAEFADAFHCQPGDPMVTAEEEKCYLLPTD
uniref:Peptidase M13 C-terminal domain-containing protein n=1 Tax=Plectus sambesii TaxID=2011161 RepID=A0A914XHC0_9BILA